MINRRDFERVTPDREILVKEDTGELINYYHLKDISQCGMYLLRKISSKSEKVSTFTFLLPNLMEKTVDGEVFETRLDDTGTYGTAVKFVNNTDELESIIRTIKNL